MSDPNQPSTPAGWYPDGTGGQRWWDGTRWTEHTMPAPGAAQPSPPAAPAQPEPPADPTATVVAPPRDPAPGTPPQGPPPQGPPPQGPPPQSPPAQAGQTPQGHAYAQHEYAQPEYAQQGYPQQGQAWQPQGGGSGGGKGKGKGKLIALIGGGVVLLVALALVLVFVVLGGGGAKGVAEDYLKAQIDGDQEKVCELSTKDSMKDAFEFYEVDNCGDLAEKIEEGEEFDEFQDVLDDVDTDLKVNDAKEDGDKATVTYTLDLEYTGDDKAKFTEVFGEEDTKTTEKGTVNLVKEDGDWLVSGEDTEE